MISMNHGFCFVVHLGKLRVVSSLFYKKKYTKINSKIKKHIIIQRININNKIF